MLPTSFRSLPYVTLCALLTLALPDGAGPIEPSADVGASSLDEVQKAAREIDKLVLLDLREHGMRPNRLIDDATFVRRAYLAIVGRIPSAAEADAFLRTQKQAKRSQLIDQLLDSPGHVSHMFNWWADLLRVRTRLSQRISGEPYMHWIKKSIAEAKPYDQMVRELLTATGAAHAEDNGATGFILRDRGMPEDNMANAVRTFLGTRLECAQCHNHPFDKWKQQDFFGMAAFAGDIQYTDVEMARRLRNMRGMQKELSAKYGDQAARQAIRNTVRSAVYGVSGSGTGLARLPDDYKYDDAKPKSLIEAKTIFGEAVEVETRPLSQRQLRGRGRRQPKNKKRRRKLPTGQPVDSRTAYADWMTSPENPRFTKVIANRMWKLVMGVGLIEPVDDLKEDTKSSQPELMAYVERVMVDVRYDLKQYLRVLFNTRTWQSEVAEAGAQPGEAYHFTGPSLRRLSAEQMWDSMLGLMIDDVDSTLLESDTRAKPIYERHLKMASGTRADLKQYIEEFAARRANPQMARQKRQRQQRKEREGIQKKLRPLQRKLREARRRRNKSAQAGVLAEIEKVRAEARGRYRRRGRGNILARASDVQQPAPAGHFLRQFGQSDRDQIQASHQDAAVPQVLSLINGFVEDSVIGNRSSALMKTVENARGPVAKIRAAFLGTLNRRPTQSELAMWKADMAKAPLQATKDLVWTLVNTHEFRFIR